MSQPSDEDILAFLHGEPEVRERVLDWIEESEENARAVRSAAAGLEAVGAWARDTHPLHSDPGARSGAATPSERRAPAPRSVPAWWVPVAAAAAMAISIPLARATSSAAPVVESAGVTPAGAPVAPDPSFVLVLHGIWPDAAGLPGPEVERRAREYWAWTSELADREILLAAGDLRWEPGVRLAGSLGRTATGATSEPNTSTPTLGAGAPIQAGDFLVGMFAIRVSSYEEAQAIAADCPHLRYGGSVSVRQVGGGFVTVPGMDDWSD